MKKHFCSVCLMIMAAALLCGCRTPMYPLAKPARWNRAEFWYQDEKPVDEKKVDVFYVVSTDIVSSKYADGRKSPLALLTQEECTTLAAESEWFRKHIYTDEFNYFSPMYHQVTFESLGNPRGGRNALWDEAAQEVCAAFDYYMAHKNHGRRFILAGFSQGASILRAILRHMTDEQYSRCIAAYAIGFQVTQDDLKSPHIKPAQGADDQGVVISFNSVSELGGKWDLVSGEAACAINPANWKTDGTPATFEIFGRSVTVSLDTASHLLVVSGFEPKKNAFSDFFPKGNLHTSDRVLYAKFLRENAILRAYGK